MTNEQKKIRITVRIQESFSKALDSWLKKLHLRRDTYLNHVLLGELDHLEKLSPNSEKVAKYLRQQRGAIPGKQKMVMTLDEELVSRMNQVCEAKGIVRDAFLEDFITYLLIGDSERDIVSPLLKASEYLNDPRRDWDQSEKPYEELHMTDELF